MKNMVTYEPYEQDIHWNLLTDQEKVNTVKSWKFLCDKFPNGGGHVHLENWYGMENLKNVEKNLEV